MNLKEYRNHLDAAGKSEGTVAQRLYHLDYLRRTHPDLLAVTADDLEQFLADRRGQSAEYRKALRSSFRSYYQWAYRRRLINRDPSAELPPIRVPKTIPRIAADPDVDHALDGATVRDTAIILLGRVGGLRLSEITCLKIQSRDFNRLVFRGKGGKERVVPIDDDLLLHALMELERELGSEGYYFPGRFGGHLHISTVYRVVRDRVGINTHALRHAAGTAGYDETHDIRAVQEFLGHASVATTQIYTHVSGNALRGVSRATSFRRRGVIAFPAQPPPEVLPRAA
jgi:integrase/recombinase XerC